MAEEPTKRRGIIGQLSRVLSHSTLSFLYHNYSPSFRVNCEICGMMTKLNAIYDRHIYPDRISLEIWTR